MTQIEESLDMLTSGSNWFNQRNQKLVTAVFITNTEGNFNPKFLAANPPQVVFITDSGVPMSTTVEKFLANHTFYNVNVEAEQLIEALRSGAAAKDVLASLVQPDEEPDTATPAKVTSDDVAVFKAKPSTPIGVQFLTVEGDTRNPPLLSSDDLQSALLAVEQEPIIIERNGGLSHVGTRIALVFNNAPDFDTVVESVFDPASVTANYAGFQLGQDLFQIDAYLGTSVQHTRAGSSLVVHLAQLEEQEEESAEETEVGADAVGDESTTEAELAPAADAPKDFSALAASLAAQQSAPAAAVATSAQAAQAGGAAVTEAGQQAAQAAQQGGAAVSFS